MYMDPRYAGRFTRDRGPHVEDLEERIYLFAFLIELRYLKY